MKLFIHENAYENTVCETAAILSRGCVWGVCVCVCVCVGGGGGGGGGGGTWYK